MPVMKKRMQREFVLCPLHLDQREAQTSTPVTSGLGNCSGVGVDSTGFGGTSLAECLERMARTPFFLAIWLRQRGNR